MTCLSIVSGTSSRLSGGRAESARQMGENDAATRRFAANPANSIQIKSRRAVSPSAGNALAARVRYDTRRRGQTRPAHIACRTHVYQVV